MTGTRAGLLLIWGVVACGGPQPAAIGPAPRPESPPLAGVRVGASYPAVLAACGAQASTDSDDARCGELPAQIASLGDTDFFRDSPVSCDEDPAWCNICDQLPGACGARLTVSRCDASEPVVCAARFEAALRPGGRGLAEVFQVVREELARAHGPGESSGPPHCDSQPEHCLEADRGLSHRFAGPGYVLELSIRRSWLPSAVGVLGFLTLDMHDA